MNAKSAVKAGKKGSIRNRLVGFLIETVVISMLLVLMSIGLYGVMQRVYRRSLDRMFLLNDFYSNLEEINREVYTYTLEGDETTYWSIAAACTENRSILAELADMNVSRVFYRDIRDVEEMFYTYTTCIGKIYDHSYLCESLTIGSKAIINGYYSETQRVYEALVSEFQGLYSELLTALNARREAEQQRDVFILIDLIVVVLAGLVIQTRRILSLSSRVIQPVQALTESAREIESTNMEVVQLVEEDQESEDEMKMLIEVYNSMIQRIQTQIRTIQENASAKEALKDTELENLRIRNLLKSSELKALQMQINPHFLFNTLNMISQTAYLENANQTVDLLDRTAKLLRYTLDNTDKAVPLSRELEVLGYYVELQEYRFGDRIQFRFELDECFHSTPVPSMILQPLVENALTHGVGMKLNGACIVIRTRYEEETNTGVIEVDDNGVGMSEEQLAFVREEMKNTEQVGQKIGLSNIYLRLKLFFNQEADVEIFSREEVGTRVRLSFVCGTFREGGTGYVPGDHRG